MNRRETEVRTERLAMRPIGEEDRPRFVELFCDRTFMVYSATGALDLDAAHARVDRLIARAAEIPFAKQAVVERATGTIVGYAGADVADWEEFDVPSDLMPLAGDLHLEWGYRLVEGRRGRGYATEASRALLTLAAETCTGDMLAVIDPTNDPSRNVLRKLDFRLVGKVAVDGFDGELHTLAIGGSRGARVPR